MSGGQPFPAPGTRPGIAAAAPAGSAPPVARGTGEARGTTGLTGLGPLAVLLRDPEVTDVLVNGPDQVWIERAGRLRHTGVRFPDDAAVRGLAVRLAGSGGRRLDTAMPFADVRLPDGSRLHAVLSPPALGGTCLSLRRPRPRPFTLDELTTVGTIGRPEAVVLRAVLAARLTTVISGGTGTGKSTLLAALLDAVPANERVVLVEDTAELVLARVNLVRMEARPPNIEGAGEITQRELVRQALRMRPDRLVVGEVRGPEVLDLLMAMNTGHEGGMGTVHANTAETVPARFEALGALAGLPRAALHSHLAAAVHVAVHLGRDGAGARRIAGIGVVRRDADGTVRIVPALAGGTGPIHRGALGDQRAPGGRKARGDRGATGDRGVGGGLFAGAAREGLPVLRALLHDRGVSLWPFDQEPAVRRGPMPAPVTGPPPPASAPGAR